MYNVDSIFNNSSYLLRYFFVLQYLFTNGYFRSITHRLFNAIYTYVCMHIETLQLSKDMLTRQKLQLKTKLVKKLPGISLCFSFIFCVFHIKSAMYLVIL